MTTINHRGRTRGFVSPYGRLPSAVKLRLISEILVTYVQMRRRMSRSDLRDLVRLARADAPTSPPGVDGSADRHRVALRLGRVVNRTLRVLPTDARCLVQSLVLVRLLSVRGITNQIVIGAHSAPEFEAHAWVEHGGLPVLPTQGFADSRLIEL